MSRSKSRCLQSVEVSQWSIGGHFGEATEGELAIAGIKKSVLALFVVLVAMALIGQAASRADNTALPDPQRTPKPPLADGFPHNQKEHRKIECAACHLGAKVKPVNSDQPMAKDFPHAACVRCHNFAAEFFKVALGGTSRFCSICHVAGRISSGDKSLKPGNIASKNSEFDDLFGHEGHRLRIPDYVRIRPADLRSQTDYGRQFRTGAAPACTDCHAPLMQPPMQRITQAPEMVKDMRTEKSHPACFVCHGGPPPSPRTVAATKFPYENDCAVCHALVENGPARNRDYSIFGSIKKFRHNDHDLDIRPKKKSDLPLPTAPDFMCAQCHQPIEQAKSLAEIKLPQAEYCNQCHKTRKPGLPDKLSDEALGKLGKRP